MKQIAGFKAALQHIALPLWDQGLNNLAIYPVAGLGPSIDLDNTWLIPIDPLFLPREMPLFHPSTWDREYKVFLDRFREEIVQNYEAYRDFRGNPRTHDGRKIAIEEFEANIFQVSWISGYAGGYKQMGIENVPPVGSLLRKISDDTDRQWLALFKRNPHWLKVLDEIPISETPELLLTRIKEMQECFYPSHPRGHYPYL